MIAICPVRRLYYPPFRRIQFVTHSVTVFALASLSPVVVFTCQVIVADIALALLFGITSSKLQC